MAYYTPAALSDQILSLPGATSPLLSNQFSGYLDISSTKHIHYFYFESERNPATDDIFFWTNGGPGCSGLLGLFTEMGPWRAVGNRSLIRNPAAWTKEASFVFLEQPVGVGFSYTSSSVKYSDYLAYTDNLQIIKKFFEKFPERANNTFYISSESYGGHYIPQLALSIFNDNDPKSTLLEHFGGYMVGNPYTSFASGYIAMAHTFWGLQLISKSTWSVLS
jgi:carboxypeptidase C (cathepsin A)